MRTIVTSLLLALLSLPALAGDGTVSDGDISDSANISPHKLRAMAASSVVFTGTDGKLVAGQFIGDFTNNGSTATIANGAVSNAKQADMAQATIKGRASGAGTGAPTDLTGTQATAILDAFTGDSGSDGVKGAVPAPSAGDTGLGKFLHANGSWSVPATSSSGAATDLASELTNVGLHATVSGNALILTLKQKDGSTDPTGASPAKIAFRDATAATGGYVLRTATSSVSLTVPTGATLGHVSNVTQWACVYAIDNSGTIELGVSSNCQLKENKVQTSTTISTAADSFVGFYSTTGRTSKAVRIIGLLEYSQATAGTYASSVSRVGLNHGRGINDPYSDWHKTFTFTFTGFGTVANDQIFWRRQGNKMELQGGWDAGTVAASAASIILPSSIALDPDFLHNENHTSFGSLFELTGTGQFYTGNVVPVAFYDLSDVNSLFMSTSSATVSTFTKTNGSSMQGNGGAMMIENVLSFPVEGWEL